MITEALARRGEALTAQGVPFVQATVVRAQRPTSVVAGAVALVLGDGSIEGFVGGVCAEQSVRVNAMRALETGEAVLLRILPEADGASLEAPEDEGAVTVHNPCLSGGAIEIFLEPMLPAPRVLVAGTSPVAGALERLAREVGLDVVTVGDGPPEPAEGDLALVVAAHGRGELDALRRGLDASLPYVGLVASDVRGAAVVEELRAAGVDEVQLATLDTPAGIEIGARTPGEIALAILARIVAVRRGSEHERSSHPPPRAAALSGPATAVDPICGMVVAAVPDTPHLEHDGRVLYFCGDGCKATFEQEQGVVGAAT